MKRSREPDLYVKCLDTAGEPNSRCKVLGQAIEIDGRYHNAVEKQVQYDVKGENDIPEMGSRILRFTEAEAMFETERVVFQIGEIIHNLLDARKGVNLPGEKSGLFVRRLTR